MGLRLALLATVLLCCTPGLLAASIMQDIKAGPGSTEPKILVLGDSLAEDGTGLNGWVSQLHSAYEGKIGLFNLGGSLQSAKDASTALGQLLHAPGNKATLNNVALVVLAFGSSEIHAAHAGSTEAWATPAAFEKALAGMVQQLRDNGMKNLVLVQPPPVASFQNALPYARAVADVARQFQVPYVDTLSAIAAMPEWKTLALKDQKLTNKGHDVLFSRVAAEIKRKMPAVSPEALLQSSSHNTAVSVAAAHVTGAAAAFDPSRDTEPLKAHRHASAAHAAVAGTVDAALLHRHRGGRAQPAITEELESQRDPRRKWSAPVPAETAEDAEPIEELPAPLLALQASARKVAAEQRDARQATAHAHAPVLALQDAAKQAQQRASGVQRQAHGAATAAFLDQAPEVPAVQQQLNSVPPRQTATPSQRKPREWDFFADIMMDGPRTRSSSQHAVLADTQGKPAEAVPPVNTDKPADAPAAKAKEPTAADKPAADKPAADKPATDKPAADKPAADKPAADKPAADKPATDKPATDKPAASAEKPGSDAPKQGDASNSPQQALADQGNKEGVQASILAVPAHAKRPVAAQPHNPPAAAGSKPVDNKPLTHAAPVHPTKPAPTIPAKPAPAHPTTPAKPEPAHPTTPAKPEPAHPTTPAKPEPAHPTTPAKPAPAHPTTPAKPEPAHPTTPAKPTPPHHTTPAKPTPPHPTTPAKPTPSTPTNPAVGGKAKEAPIAKHAPVQPKPAQGGNKGAHKADAAVTNAVNPESWEFLSDVLSDTLDDMTAAQGAKSGTQGANQVKKQAPSSTQDKTAAPAKPETQPADKPAADKPTAAGDKPAADKPAADAQKPAADKPAADKPTAAGDKPAADKPAADEQKPAADKPAADAQKPAADKPAADAQKPAADKPAANKPAADAQKPAADKPAADKPAADAQKPAADKPAADKPAADKPTAAGDKPAAETQKPAAHKPAADAQKPAADKPAADAQKPAADKPAADKPAADKPTAAGDKPTAETQKPAADKPAADAQKPAADKPAADAQKPAADKPAADKPAADKPAADKPAADKPTAAGDKSAADKPAAETQKPAADKPAAETQKPAADKPAADAQKPAGDKPAADKPAADAQKPAADKPAADKPAADAQKPAADKPAADKPTADAQKPAADKPAADKPAAGAQKPAADKPAADKPTADAQKPAADKPAAEKPAAAGDEPVADKPAAETQKPAAEMQKPAAETQKPTADKPAAEKPVDDKSAADKPTADKPAADTWKPVADKPAADAQKPASDKPAADAGSKIPPSFDDKLLTGQGQNLPAPLANWRPEETQTAQKSDADLVYWPSRRSGKNTQKKKDTQSFSNLLAKLTPSWWPTKDGTAEDDAQAEQMGNQTVSANQTLPTFGLQRLAGLFASNSSDKPHNEQQGLRALPPKDARHGSRRHQRPTVDRNRVHNKLRHHSGTSGRTDGRADPELQAETQGKAADSATYGRTFDSPPTPADASQDTMQGRPADDHPAHSTFGSRPDADAAPHHTLVGALAEGPDRATQPAAEHFQADTFANADKEPTGTIAHGQHADALKRPDKEGIAEQRPQPQPTFGMGGARQDEVPPRPVPTFGASPRDQQPGRPSRPTLTMAAPKREDPDRHGQPVPTFGAPDLRQGGNPVPQENLPHPSTLSGSAGAHPGPSHPAPEPKALHMGQAPGHKAAPGVLDAQGDLAPEQVALAHNVMDGKEPEHKDNSDEPDEGDTDDHNGTAGRKHKDHKKHKKDHEEDDEGEYIYKGHVVKGRKEHKHGRKHRDHHKAGHGTDEDYPSEDEHEQEPEPKGKHKDDKAKTGSVAGEAEAADSAADGLGEIDDAPEELDQAADNKPQDINSAISGAEEDASKPLIVTLGDYVMRQGSFGTGIIASGDKASGWISRLAAAYGTKAQVVNKGQATATSQNGLAMVEELLKETPNAGQRVKLVVLSFGGNDAITRTEEDKPKVALAAYKTNLQTMVTKLREAGISNVLLVTPPPAARRVDRRFKTIKDYAKAATDVAHSMNVPTVDLFAAVASLPNWQAAAMKEDGLRLSERGQQLLFKRVVKALNVKLQSVSPAKLTSR